MANPSNYQASLADLAEDFLKASFANGDFNDNLRPRDMPRIPIILLGLLSVSLVSGAAPTWQAELSSPQPGNFGQLPPTELNFQVSWQGMIKAGTLKIQFAPDGVKKPGAYVVRAVAASTGPAALLFPYTSDFWSEINPNTLRPIYFRSLEIDDKESVITTVRHFPTEIISQESAKNIKTGKTKVTDRIFDYSPVFDLFSAMLQVRSQKLATGDHITLVIHPFDTPYLLHVVVIGREIHMEQNTIRLSVGLRKIDRKTLGLLPYKKLKKDATMWLSDDALRVPIELRAAAFIGDVRATLVHQ